MRSTTGGSTSRPSRESTVAAVTVAPPASAPIFPTSRSPISWSERSTRSSTAEPCPRGEPTPARGLLVDKPAGMTSHDVVAKVRRERGGKVGHAGTLDPFATGLLVLLLGRATRLQRYLLELPKTYRATARLGWRSSTGDPDGELTETGRIPERLDLVGRALAVAARAARRGRPRPARGGLDRLAAVRLAVEPLAVDPDRRGHRHPLVDLARRQLEPARGSARSRSARRRDRRCSSASRAAPWPR